VHLQDYKFIQEVPFLRNNTESILELVKIIDKSLLGIPIKNIYNAIEKRRPLVIIICKDNKNNVIGGLIYKNHKNHFIEVLFLAVKEDERRKRIGSFLIDILKDATPPFINTLFVKADRGSFGFYYNNGFTMNTLIPNSCVSEQKVIFPFGTINMECHRHIGGFLKKTQ